MENTFYDTIGNLYKLIHCNGKNGKYLLANKIWNIQHPGVSVESYNNEYNSWVNSLPLLIDDIHSAGLDNLDLLMEYELTDGNGSIDAILVGRDHQNKDQILLVENKQWTNNGIHPGIDPTYVNIDIGNGAQDSRRHPIEQLRSYYYALKNNHSYLSNRRTNILIAAYVHNLCDTSVLSKGVYNINAIRKFKGKPYSHFIFGKKDRDKNNGRFIKFLKNNFINTNNRSLTNKILAGTYIYSDVNLKNIDKVKPNPEQYQLVASLRPDLIRLIRDQNYQNKEIIIIRGCAGTGKTVIGFYLINYYRQLYKKVFHKDDKSSDAIYSTAKSFEIHSYIGFKYNKGLPVAYADNISGYPHLLVVDEAQRISNVNQLKRYLSRTQVLVLLEDDRQVISPRDNGLFPRFKQFIDYYHIPHKYPQPLKTEMRNKGGKDFTKSVMNLLYGTNFNVVNNQFNNYAILDAGNNLAKIKSQMNTWKEQNNLVKWVAPFCWPWTGARDGRRIDINFKDAYGNRFAHPWNPKPARLQGEWLNSKDDTKPVACVYTTQGLQCDYEGLIWWDDLVWIPSNDEQKGHWHINYNKIKDGSYKYYISHPTPENKQKIKQCILNTYYILLTRARKGIAIWFKDPLTEQHVRKVLHMAPLS